MQWNLAKLLNWAKRYWWLVALYVLVSLAFKASLLIFLLSLVRG